jgi:hypothetical protein
MATKRALRFRSIYLAFSLGARLLGGRSLLSNLTADFVHKGLRNPKSRILHLPQSVSNRADHSPFSCEHNYSEGANKAALKRGSATSRFAIVHHREILWIF